MSLFLSLNNLKRTSKNAIRRRKILSDFLHFRNTCAYIFAAHVQTMIENFKKEVIRYEQAEQKPEPVYRESEAEQRAEQESADRHPEQEERPSVLSAVCPVESVPWQAFHRDGMREGLSEPGSESPFPFYAPLAKRRHILRCCKK